MAASEAVVLPPPLDLSKARRLAWRDGQLRKIKEMLQKEEGRVATALQEDLGKCRLEAVLHEIHLCLGEVDQCIKNLHTWNAGQPVATPVAQVKGLSRSFLQPQPYGAVLLIAPWNYPFQLAIAPLIGIITAGNCCVVKPSELAPATSELLQELIEKYLDGDCIRCVTGGVEATTELLKQKWDYIFFTGSTGVGRVILRAAAEHLTPVTLELGGKSPCIVDRSIDFDVTCRRIAWGKWSNAGQTCIAPDYLVVHREVRDRLLEGITRCIEQFYGSDPSQSESYGRIINLRHHARLCNMLTDGKATIHCGGQSDETSKYIAPTVLVDVAPDALCMQDEIFGPILPVVVVDDMEGALRFINGLPGKPLSMYLFTKERRTVQQFLDTTTSGSAVINDCLTQFANTNLPFGGVGESGMGRYHGKYSFDCFTHHRAVMDKTTMFDLDLRYPPYDDQKMKMLRAVL